MDRSDYLITLPFLIPVSFESGPIICRHHLKQILQSESDDLEVIKIFPSHVVSIEPISHKSQKCTGPAFFCTKTSDADSKDMNCDSSSTSHREYLESDPSLTKFNAYLVPVHHHDNNLQRSPCPNSIGKNPSSPVPSSASTSLSKSQSPWTPRINTLSSSDALNINLLYFAVGDLRKIDSDIIFYCVDPCQIRALEVVGTKESGDRFHERASESIREPHCLTIQFDTCLFRIFHEKIVTEIKTEEIAHQNTIHEAFSSIKTHILSEGRRSAEFREGNLSFGQYISLISPSHNAISVQHTHDMEGQTSHELITYMNRESDEKVESKPSHEKTSLIENQLDIYSRSWRGILALDALTKLEKKDRIDTLNSGNKVFTSVAKTCTTLCSKLYVTESETDLIEEEERLENKVSEIDGKMNDIMRTLFPVKKDAILIQKPNAEEIVHLEAQLEMHLEAYKSAIKNRHGTAFYLQR